MGTGHVVETPSAAGIKQMQLTPAPTGDPLLALVDRLAHDPTIDVGKLEKILDLQRGLRADQAKAEYQMAFAAMSEELPVITKRGEIKNKAGQVQSKYAKYEDIQRVIKPILRRHGFTCNHEQNPPNSAEMVLTTFLIHRGGHSQQSTFRAKSDESGSKNDVQGLGSISSYAKRYNVIGLLDLEMEGADNDGQGEPKPAPDGFEKWCDAIDNFVLAGCTRPQLNAKWEEGGAAIEPFRRYIATANPAHVEGWKKACKVPK